MGGERKSLINNLTDALAHYRSGAGGTVPAGPGLYSEMQSDSSYETRIMGNDSVLAQRIIDNTLSKVSKSQTSGTIQNVPGSTIGNLECSTLGSYGFNISYSATWNATNWTYDATEEKYYRYVTAPVTVSLSGSNGWNFDWNADYNLWENITRELIPGWIAGARGNPANFTITYSTSVFYELTVKQYE